MAQLCRMMISVFLMSLSVQEKERIRGEDVSVILTEMKKEDWSFGNGIHI